jgi:hypothetical protein
MTIVPFERTLEATSSIRRPLRLAIYAGYLAAALLAMISFGGITLSSAYARETPNWATQAIAQDWFDLLIAAPSIALATVFAARGSRRALIVLAGALLFAVYTLAIYCFAVHVNALFLLYCAGFGVSLYSLIFIAAALLRSDATAWFERSIPRRTVGAALIALGVAFAVLWLMQLAPAVTSGTPPRDLVETGLLTNPIHVLDLSFVLPLHVIAGVALLQRRSSGFVLAPALLAFGALMSGSIAVLAVLLDLRGFTMGGMAVAGAMTFVAVLSALLLVLMLRKHVAE